MVGFNRVLGKRKEPVVYSRSNLFCLTNSVKSFEVFSLFVPKGLYRYMSIEDATKDKEKWISQTIFNNIKGVKVENHNKTHSKPASMYDVLNLINLLNKFNVEYILVGGYAQQFLGYMRQTFDIDIAVNPSIENSKKWVLALSELPDKVAKILANEEDPFQGDYLHAIRICDEIVVDIMPSVSGVLFDELLQYVFEKEVDGVVVKLLNVEGLIRVKKNSLREQDKHDVQILKKSMDF